MSTNKTPQTRALKVGPNHNVKTVAGYLAHAFRRGETPSILSARAPAVNQSVKALAIARGFLKKDDIQFVVTATTPLSKDNTRTRVIFHVHPVKEPIVLAEEDGTTTLKASATTQSNNIAGAIAKKMRANEKPVVSAIGAEAIFNAILGIAQANRFLRDDNISIAFVAEFKQVGTENDSRSAIYFYIVPYKA